MSVDINTELSQVFNSMYKTLTPAVLIVNFNDGSSLTNKQHEGFLTIKKVSPAKRLQAVRLQLDNNTYSISRKDPKNLDLPGFFYHIKEGRATIMGKYDIEIPFFAERIGFCYNSKGDSICIRLDHGSFVKGMSGKISRINSALNSLIVYNQKKKAKDKKGMKEAKKEINKILAEPISYRVNVSFYKENIVEKKVSTSLFGKLEELPGKSFGLPWVTENTKEVQVEFAPKK